jgi:hypothetical protein
LYSPPLNFPDPRKSTAAPLIVAGSIPLAIKNPAGILSPNVEATEARLQRSAGQPEYFCGDPHSANRAEKSKFS